MVRRRKRPRKWTQYPSDWEGESREEYWRKITDGHKHKVYRCIDVVSKKGIEDPGRFCAGMADEFEGMEWRSWPKRRRKNKRRRRTAAADVTPIRQRTQYSCMATSMAMCLNALGYEVSEDEVNKVMGAAPLTGASWENALAAAQHYGCRATLTTPSTITQIKEWTDQGIPVIVSWNPEGREWSHASVVFDVDEDQNVFVADPNIPDPEKTVRVVPKEDFYGKWYETWPNYLVRRVACAVAREISEDGLQNKPVRARQTLLRGVDSKDTREVRDGITGRGGVSRTAALSEKDQQELRKGYLSARIRRHINNDLARVGLDGKGRFVSVSRGVVALQNVLTDHNLLANTVGVRFTSDFSFEDREGWKSLEVISYDPLNTRSEEVVLGNTRVSFHWYVLETDDVEIVAYLG